jgi:hypothetical protein
MSQSYLVPIVQAPIGPNSQVVFAPKYLGTDFTGAFSSMPYGLEPLCLLTLPAPSSLLATESDVYTFGDVTAILSDDDAAVLSGFLISNNIPDDCVLSGDPLIVSLVAIAKVFLCAQFVSGQTGQAVFGVSGAGLSSPFSASPAAAVLASVSASPSLGQATGVGTGVGTETGGAGSAPFDFSNVDSDSAIGDVLVAVSQQFNSPISLGGF